MCKIAKNNMLLVTNKNEYHFDTVDTAMTLKEEKKAKERKLPHEISQNTDAPLVPKLQVQLDSCQKVSCEVKM